MSFNPVRAKNWNKRNGRTRRPLDPHAGTKHSDIVRRSGMGATIPLENRQQTESGFMASIMETEGFSVRQEMIRAGTSIGYGHHLEANRVIRVLDGMLFVFEVGADGERQTRPLNVGGYFQAPAGKEYGYATSGTADAEILIIETPNYRAGWESLEEGVISTNQPEVFVAPPQDDLTKPERRPREQSRAKEQAMRSARRKVRRQPKRTTSAAPRGPSPSGAKQIGRNASTNTNSSNVDGVNPQPLGAGAYKQD